MDSHRTLEETLSEQFGERVSIEIKSQQELAGTRVTVVTMNYHDRAGTGESQNRTHINQSAVVLEQAELNLPQFLLRPAVTGITGKFLAMAGNLGNITFDESPDFSKLYYLHGWVEETVRVLFVREIRDYFTRFPGWSVRGRGTWLTVYKQGKVVSGENRESFTRDAVEILTLFQSGKHALDARPDLRRETHPSDVAATAQRMDGIAGAMLRKQLNKIRLTRAQVDSFVASPTPRPVPVGLKRQVVGQWMIAIVFASLFAFAGIVVGVALIVFGKGIQRLLGAMFLTTPLIGFLIAYLGYRFYHRKVRLLRFGEFASALITNVTLTNTMIDNQPQYNVRLEYDVSGKQKAVECKVLGVAGDLAQSKRDTRERVRILIDPQDTNHSICLDLLTFSD